MGSTTLLGVSPAGELELCRDEEGQTEHKKCVKEGLAPSENAGLQWGWRERGEGSKKGISWTNFETVLPRCRRRPHGR